MTDDHEQASSSANIEDATTTVGNHQQQQEKDPATTVVDYNNDDDNDEDVKVKAKNAGKGTTADEKMDKIAFAKSTATQDSSMMKSKYLYNDRKLPLASLDAATKKSMGDKNNNHHAAAAVPAAAAAAASASAAATAAADSVAKSKWTQRGQPVARYKKPLHYDDDDNEYDDEKGIGKHEKQPYGTAVHVTEEDDRTLLEQKKGAAGQSLGSQRKQMIEQERIRLMLGEDLVESKIRREQEQQEHNDSKMAARLEREQQQPDNVRHHSSSSTTHAPDMNRADTLPGAFSVPGWRPNHNNNNRNNNVYDDDNNYNNNDLDYEIAQVEDDDDEEVNAQVLVEQLNVRNEISQLRSKFVSARVISVEDDSQLLSPSSRHKKTRLYIGIGSLVILTVIAVIIGVIVSQKKRGGDAPLEEELNGNQTRNSNSSSFGQSYDSGCIPDTNTLISAVDLYLANSSNGTEVALKYGWPIGKWCVSPIQDFSRIFDGTRNTTTKIGAFNEPLDEWDVSQGTSFFRMFYEANSFNQDLSSWNMSRAKDVSLMFHRAALFNQNLATWDLSSVTTMAFMFMQASVFNGDISTWNVRNVMDMSSMFSNAAAFNSDISQWQVWNVGSMGSMFEMADAFNRDISAWQTLNLTGTSAMFKRATNFNQDLSNWTMSYVTTTESMFENAVAFNQDISSWNLSSVETMDSMFEGASSFNQNLCAWRDTLAVSEDLTTEDMFVKTSCPNTIANLTEQAFSLCQPCA